QAVGLAALDGERGAAHRRYAAAKTHFELLDLQQGAQGSVLAPNRSRRPSPRRLMPSTSTNSATPGMTITQGLKNMYSLASAIIRPHDGSGGGTPSPRNDSAASSRMASATSSVATTTRWLAMLGSTSPLTMRKREQPAHQAAATKSRLRTCMVVERATTAKRSHSRRPRVSTRRVIELPSRPTTASATRTTGMER